MRAHESLSAAAARDRAIELLRSVGIPDAEQRVDDYPHQFSGGMRQRVMIAMALSCSPRVLIADEPTTALDVTIQAQILDLIRTLRRETGSSVVLITHDMGVVAELADRVLVMYGGRIVEQGPTRAIFHDPLHPYTWGLLGSIARLDRPRPHRLTAIGGSPAPAWATPSGCVFADRCPHRFERCSEPPPLVAKRGARPPRRLLAADREAGRAAVSEPLLRATDVHRHFGVRGNGVVRRDVATVRAVDGVSLEVQAGETLGLVGESGCGKSTLGRALLRLTELTSGRIEFDGRDISTLSRAQLRPARRDMQMVFQDPYASLNPRKRVSSIIGRPMRIHGTHPRSEIPDRVRELLGLVGLRPEHADRFPHEFSGGQRQRIGIARALALNPKLVIADEPVSALDVSVRAQVINLMEDLQDELGLTYVFVAHDLSVVRQVSDRIAVMYLGKLVEVGPAERVSTLPVHPYTEALLSAVPVPDPDVSARRERIVLRGDVPSPASPPSGCRFHTRCPHATEICTTDEPPLVAHRDAHLAACHHPRNV